jgi:hypothetical protein
MFPENILKVVRKFADDVVNSLQFALKSVPDNLTYVKMKCESITFGKPETPNAWHITVDITPL